MTGSELHFHDFALGGLHFEESSSIRRESEQVRDGVGGERLGLVAAVPEVSVVEAARGLDAVLGVDRFLLQLQELGVGLQVGVVLGEGEDAIKAGDQLFLGNGLFGGAAVVGPAANRS